jgi:hypothetical protein
VKDESDILLRMLNRATAPAADFPGENLDGAVGDPLPHGLEAEATALRQGWLGLCNLLEAADCQNRHVAKPNSLSGNCRGLAHFAMPCEQNAPVPFSADGSRMGSKAPILVERANPGGLAAKASGRSSRNWAVVAVAVSVLIAVAGTIMFEIHKQAEPVLQSPQDVARIEPAQTKTPPTPAESPREQRRDDSADVAEHHSQQPSQPKSASAPAADPRQPRIGKQRVPPSENSPDAEMAAATEGSLRADSVDDEIAAVSQVTALVQHDWYVQSTNVGTIASGIDELEREMSAGSL